jgi:hypothetical protein
MGRKRTLAHRRPTGTPTTVKRTKQTFVNETDHPIYVSIEPWPECFELEPQDKLTLVYEPVEAGDAPSIHFVNERELVIWPTAKDDEIEYLINDERAEHLSWKHKQL